MACPPHFTDNPDRFIKEAGLTAQEPFSGSHGGQVLAGRAKGQHVNRRDLPSVQPFDISQMLHLRKMVPGNGHRRLFDFTCPQRTDMKMPCCKREYPDPVKQTAQRNLHALPPLTGSVPAALSESLSPPAESASSAVPEKFPSSCQNDRTDLPPFYRHRSFPPSGLKPLEAPTG